MIALGCWEFIRESRPAALESHRAGRQDTASLFPTVLLTLDELPSFSDLSSSSISKMGGCGEMDSWWAVVAVSGGKTGGQELAPLQEGRCLYTDPLVGGSPHLGMGQECDQIRGHFRDRLPCRGMVRSLFLCHAVVIPWLLL